MTPRILFAEMAAEVAAFSGMTWGRLMAEPGHAGPRGGDSVWADVAVVGIKLAFVLAVMLTTVPIMVWVERRGSALIQDRLGPNRVGPFGLLQPVIDVVKLITKENLRPEGAQTFLYLLAPVIAVAISLSTFIAVPFGARVGLELFGHPVDGFIVAPDLNIGVLYIFAIASLAVYPVVLAGWASNNKYALYGGIRASAQAISYELAMTMAVVGVLMSGRFAAPPADG